MLLVLLLIAVLPLKQHPLWNSYVGSFTVVKYLGAVSLAYALFHVVKRKRIPAYFTTWQSRCYVLLIGLIYLSSLRSEVSLAAISDPLQIATSLLLLQVILLSVIDNLPRLRWALLGIVGSVAWASLYVLREWQQSRGWITGHRPGWIVGDSNHFAVSAVCGIALAWCLSRNRFPTWQRKCCLGCMVLILMAVTVGGSRGGFLGVAATMLFVALGSRNRIRNVAAIVILLVGFNVFYPFSPLHRLIDPTVNDEGSERAHRASWSAGLNMIRAHPIEGVGFGTFKSQMWAYRPAWYDGPSTMAHNAYIEVGAEMGIPAFVVFVIMLGSAYTSLGRIRRRESLPPLLRQAAHGLQAGLVGCSVSIAFISAEFHEHLGVIVFMSACLAPLASRALNKQSLAKSEYSRRETRLLGTTLQPQR